MPRTHTYCRVLSTLLSTLPAAGHNATGAKYVGCRLLLLSPF
jgi:hypothetical protein